MAINVKVLIPAKTAEAALTTQYIATRVTALIDKFTATNYSAAAASLSVYLVTAGDSAANNNLIVQTKTLQTGETYTFPELVGQALAPSGYISTLASVANSINIRSSGREIT